VTAISTDRQFLLEQSELAVSPMSQAKSILDAFRQSTAHDLEKETSPVRKKSGALNNSKLQKSSIKLTKPTKAPVKGSASIILRKNYERAMKVNPPTAPTQKPSIK